MPECLIDTNKIYKASHDYRVIEYQGSILIVIPSTANWIVLNTQSQLKIFKFLIEGNSIEEALKNPLLDNDDISFVITQIEARRLFSKEPCPVTSLSQSLHLYLTNGCNLRCPHCYMYSGSSLKEELNTDEICNLIRNFKNIAKGTHITISGGEPTIHKEFLHIIKLCSKLGLYVKLLTNGTTLTAVQISKIAPYINSVQVSIDGYSEETNSLIRGVGNFEKALETVNSFISLGVSTSIALTPSLELLKSNLNEYIDFIKTLITKYKDTDIEIRFSEALSKGRMINPSDNENEEYFRLVNNIHKTIHGDLYEVMTFIEKLDNNVILNNCMYGSLTVSADGKVFICPEISSLSPITNIRERSFIDIIAESERLKALSEITNLEPCNQCELMYICGGGCRINEFPSMKSPNSLISSVPVSTRHCSNTIKERFYNLMIQSNEYLFNPPLMNNHNVSLKK